MRETPSRPAVPVGGQVAAAAGGVSRVIGCDVIGDPGDSIFDSTTSSKGAGSYLAGMAVAIPILNVEGRRHTNNFSKNI